MGYRSYSYTTYMASPKWFDKRMAVLRRDGYACQRCCRADVPLDVHHLTYERFGDERLDDLQALCRPCHEQADMERKDEVHNRVYHARLTGWANKKYGHGWAYFEDEEQVEEEFINWATRKGIEL